MRRAYRRLYGPDAVDSSERKEGKMSSSKAKQLILGAAAAGILMASSFAAHADDKKFPPHRKTNINLAVVSNFYGFPPSNSAITYSVFRLAARRTVLCGWILPLECAPVSEKRVGLK